MFDFPEANETDIWSLISPWCFLSSWLVIFRLCSHYIFLSFLLCFSALWIITVGKLASLLGRWLFRKNNTLRVVLSMSFLLQMTILKSPLWRICTVWTTNEVDSLGGKIYYFCVYPSCLLCSLPLLLSLDLLSLVKNIMKSWNLISAASSPILATKQTEQQQNETVSARILMYLF